MLSKRKNSLKTITNIAALLLIIMVLAACTKKENTTENIDQNQETPKTESVSNQENPKTDSTQESVSDTLQETDQEIDLQENSSSIEEVSDDNEQEPTQIQDLKFGEHKYYSRATNTGSGSTLLGGAGEWALFNQYGGELYLYNIEEGYPFVVERSVSYGSLDNDATYVFYTRYQDGVLKEEQDIKVMNVNGTKERKKVGELPTGINIDNSAYHDGLFFYYASNLTNTEEITGVVAVDESFSKKASKFSKLLKKYNFTEFKKFGDQLYAFDPDNNAIYDISTGKAKVKTKVPSGLSSFAILGDTIYINYWDDSEGDFGKNIYMINGKKIDIPTAFSKTLWLNEENLLVIEEANMATNLCVYNIKTNDISRINFSDNSDYFNPYSIYFDGKKIFFAGNNIGNTEFHTLEVLHQ